MKLLFLVCFIYGLSQVNTKSYNIFEIFKAKNITCNLRSFIIQSNLTKISNDYQMFINDLNQHCWNLSTSNSSELICHMIAIELEAACLIINQSRITPIVYNSQYTSKQICSAKTVVLTNNWIWEKLSVEEKEPIGSSSINLCSFVTTNNETLRLTRFFYRLAPRVRRSNLTYSIPNITNSNTQIPIVLNNKTSIQTNKTDLHNQPREPMLEGLQPDEKPNIVKDEILVNNQNINETKLSEEGMPLGRVGEKPEREQINERPKPKPLDANVVFQQNVEDERNWVQGKNIDNKVQDPLANHLNKLPNIQIDENPMVLPQGVKKRPLFRLKFNRHSDDADDNEDLSHSFITSVLVALLCFVLLYLILHNKNKILGLIIEGCKRRRRAKNNHHVRLSHTAE